MLRTLRRLTQAGFMLACLVMVASCEDSAPKLAASPHTVNGTGVYILLDVSGSMADQVRNASGAQEAKLAVAKRAGISVCQQIAKYAQESPARNIKLAVASFSDDCRTVVPLGTPNATAAQQAINSLYTQGGTAIGNSVAQAQKELDRTGLRRQHILIITDGENTVGPKPDKVAAEISALPEDLRPNVYIVAFDVSASVFDAVKKQGWQVFSAANGKELEQRLDQVVGGHILIEQ